MPLNVARVAQGNQAPCFRAVAAVVARLRRDRKGESVANDCTADADAEAGRHVVPMMVVVGNARHLRGVFLKNGTRLMARDEIRSGEFTDPPFFFQRN